MRRLLEEEAGFSLMEVLVVCALMIVVLGATLSAFNVFERNTTINQRQNDAQDQARSASDELARELRNLASPTNELPQAVNRADPMDVIFLYVGGAKAGGSSNDRNTRRVRYCFDSGSGRIYREMQSWTSASAPAMPAATACPGSGWDSQRIVAENVVNATRPLFDYDAADLNSITNITSTLYVDVNPGSLPAETTIQTADFLRNQNREPTASFTADVTGSQVLLNGSESEDPEGRALDYYWYDTGATGNQCGTLPTEVPATGCVGTGIIFNYSPSTSGNHTLYLVARDPAGLTSTAPDQQVCTGASC
jgi:type II secretory pathway pseudopilin PulG